MLPKLYILFILTLTLLSCKKDVEITPSNTPGSYSFYVAGHTYGKPGVDNIGVHPPFKEKFDLLINDELIDFGIFTGDIVYLPTEQNWDEIDADIEELGHPVYFAPGNHDMLNRDLFESRYGDTYKSFVHKSDLFIILDPNLDNWNIIGKQLEFLKNTLKKEAGNVKNIFVFFHQILWWEPNNIYQHVIFNSDHGRAEYINFWTEVEPLFHSLKNPVYMFAGDVGANKPSTDIMYHNYDNITLIASGMGAGEQDNYVYVHIREDKSVHLELMALNEDKVSGLGRIEYYTPPQ